MLSYNDLVYAGISNVIGAGIFVIISYVYKFAGAHTWISVLLAGLFMSIFAEHYAKIPEIIKNDKDVHLEFDIINRISNPKIASGFIYMAVIGLIFSTYLVSKSFGNYLNDMIPQISDRLGSLIIISICYILNRLGIDHVAKWNNVILLFGLGILTLLILIGFYRIFTDNYGKEFFLESINPKNIKNNFFQIIKGAYMIIFSYVGFELLVKLNSDSINPQTDIPKAIRTTIVITIIIYTLLGFVYSYAISKREKENKNKTLLKQEQEQEHNNTLIEDTKNIIYDTHRIEFDEEIDHKNEAPLTYAMEILTDNKKISPIIDIGGVIFTATTTLLMMLSATKLLGGQIDKLNQTNSNLSLNIVLAGVILLLITNISIQNSTIIANICIVLLMIVVSYAVIKIRHKLL